ncbi:hypothetical protein Q5752_006057 [Cryptotrichosporon argae]
MPTNRDVARRSVTIYGPSRPGDGTASCFPASLYPNFEAGNQLYESATAFSASLQRDAQDDNFLATYSSTRIWLTDDATARDAACERLNKIDMAKLLCTATTYRLDPSVRVNPRSDLQHGLKTAMTSDDIGSAWAELNELFHIFARDQASLVDIVQTYLGSPNASVRDTTIDALLEVLDEGDVSDRRTALLEDAALSYTPLLLPLPTPSAAHLLRLIVQHASAREMTLALNEALAGLEEAAEGVAVSDDEGEIVDDTDYGELARQLGVVLELYATTIPRLAQAKSTPTLLSLADALSAIQPLSFHTSAAEARALLGRTCELVDATWAWAQTRDDRGGGQRSILSQILDQAVTLLGPRVDADLTGRAFLSAYPKYRDMYTSDAPGYSALERALAHLADALVRPSSPFASVAALVLLATAGVPATAAAVPALAAALGSACVDAGIALCFALPEIDFDASALLLELLVPLAAMSPSPLTRLAVAKLLDAIPARFTGCEHVLLLLQLLEPANPYDGVRVHALSILRAHLPALLVDGADVLGLLGPVVFAAPPDAFERDTEEPVLLSRLAWLTEAANALWLLLDLDKANATGARGPEFADKVRADLLSVIRQGIAGVQSRVEGDDNDGRQLAFAVERLADAADRAEAALAGLAT